MKNYVASVRIYHHEVSLVGNYVLGVQAESSEEASRIASEDFDTEDEVVVTVEEFRAGRLFDLINN